MEAVLLMVLSFAGYVLAYHTYGRFLGKKIFNLSDSAEVPSKTKEDGVDYVPTKKWVIFGHHFTSIAGTGPIVGPAIGIIWGWVPAMIWIFFGSILMGAVHDFGSLVISMRNEGKSLSEAAAKLVGPRVRYIFFFIVFFELLIVIAVFCLVIAVIFKMYPQSVFPVWMEIPIAIGLGYAVYKKSAGIAISTVIAVVLMYITVAAGHYIYPEHMLEFPNLPATGVWAVILLVYAFIASTLPVTTLLQPRDYINAWQLFVAMTLLFVGVLAAGLFGGLEIVAPAVNLNPSGAPPVWPFLFITIACGAISGFHSLVSSGTSSKQISSERDARFVGYGSMLTEAALATLAVIAVAAGIGLLKNEAGLAGAEAWNQHYASWAAAKGLAAKVKAFVDGSANIMTCIGIPLILGKIIIGVFIASFAGTTLDSATRVQRYVVSELFSGSRLRFLAGKYGATAFAVITAAILAFVTGADGKGALKLWPMFGAVNQLLAALALLVLTIYLRKRRGLKYLVSGIPCVFMLCMTVWSVILNQINFIKGKNALLSVINGVMILLAVWMIIEGLITFLTSGSGSDTETEGETV